MSVYTLGGDVTPLLDDYNSAIVNAHDKILLGLVKNVLLTLQP